MRFLFLVVSLISLPAYACSQQIEDGFVAFAKEAQTKDSYMVYFPDSDFSENPMYLSGITAFQTEVFSFELEFFESDSYAGYYQTLVTVSPEMLTKISIGASYSFTDESRTAFALCANWKAFTLKKLLENS